MSLDQRSVAGLPLICDLCGEVIEQGNEQRCPATDDGRRCRP